MPPVRSVRCTDNRIEFTDYTGVARVLNAAAIPGAQNTIAKAENWLNTVWIPANVTGYPMVAHVFSRSPLRVTILTLNAGEPIPANWWLDA